jgi:glycosyltransferase involved in cell wall biosynthesis
MKIAVHNGSRVWGGNEKWLLATAEGLQRRSHRVVACCRPGSVVEQRFQASGIPTARARPGVGLDLFHALSFAAWLFRERPDALLLTSWSGIFWGSWAARVAGVPRVVVRLGIVRVPTRWIHRLAFARWVDRVIVNAEEVRTAVAGWFPEDRVRLVLNGVPASTQDRGAAARWLRDLARVPAGTLVVACAGHVERRKGFDLVLRAFARGAPPSAHLVVAGKGSQLAPLEALSESLGVAQRVTWLGHRDDVPRILAGCDLFVLGSRNEGMANVMLEAMAAGTPIIATMVSGVPGALGSRPRHPSAGWMVPQEDAPALASAISEVTRLILSRDAEVDRRVREAFRRVAYDFAPERMVEEVELALAAEPSAQPASEPCVA